MSSDTPPLERAVDLIAGVLRTAGTHDTSNEAVLRLLEELRGLAEGRPGKADQPLVLLLDGDDVFLDQQLLRLDLQAWQRALALRHALESQGANELVVLPGASLQDLASFFQRFGQAARRGRPDPSLKDLALNKVAVARREIEREGTTTTAGVAVLTHLCSLVVVCEEFADRVADDGDAPVVVVRRAVQRVADAMLTAPEAWLALLLAPRPPGSPGAHAARAAGLAAFVCGQLGATRASTSRTALLALRHALVAAPSAAPTPDDLDAQVAAEALAAALHDGPWPATTPLPLDSTLAAFCVLLDRLLQDRRTPRSGAQAVSAALQAVADRGTVPTALQNRVRAVFGRTPPGTLVAAGRMGLLGPGGTLCAGPGGPVGLPVGSSVQVLAPQPGPWTAWLAAALDA